MGNNNSNLQTAKNIKDDEFYTTYEAIEKELQHYLKHFEERSFSAIAMIHLSRIFAVILYATLTSLG